MNEHRHAYIVCASTWIFENDAPASVEWSAPVRCVWLFVKPALHKSYEYGQSFVLSAVFLSFPFLVHVVLSLIGVIKLWFERRCGEKCQIFRSHLFEIQLDILINTVNSRLADNSLLPTDTPFLRTTAEVGEQEITENNSLYNGPSLLRTPNLGPDGEFAYNITKKLKPSN